MELPVTFFNFLNRFLQIVWKFTTGYFIQSVSHNIPCHPTLCQFLALWLFFFLIGDSDLGFEPYLAIAPVSADLIDQLFKH